MKVVNQVLTTNDYSLFKIIKGNRDVNKLHIKRLVDSFRDEYLLTPLIINQNYEIIDGQHRYHAAKELGLPINFIICNDYSLKQVQLLNTNMKNWKKIDYLNTFCDLGYEHYLKFRNFLQTYPDFFLETAIAFLTNKTGHNNHKSLSLFKSDTNKKGSYIIRTFENGDFEIHDYKLACINAEKILQIKALYDGYNRRTFVLTMLNLFKHENYNHNQFLQKLKLNPSALKDCNTVAQYKELIEEIYNYKSREKVNLRF
jgi:hypothetical protein